LVRSKASYQFFSLKLRLSTQCERYITSTYFELWHASLFIFSEKTKQKIVAVLESLRLQSRLQRHY